MSLRPAVRREGPLDQFLLIGIGILLGATFMLWLTGQVAGFIHSGSWPSVSLSEMGAVMAKVPRHPLDPAAAWPKQARPLLPGPVLFPPDMPAAEKQAAIDATLVKRAGTPLDVAKAVLFLIDNDFVTGVTLPVDGGRSVFGPDCLM